METIKKIIIVAAAISALGFSQIALAETPAATSASQEIQADTQVTAQDLGIKDPTILPNSSFYFIKEWARSITNFFTFNTTKKAELASKYANEKLIELQKLAEKNASAKDVKDAVENYKNSVTDLKNKIDQIPDKSTANQELTNFLNDFAKQQLLQEKALRTIIADQVTTEISDTIKEAQDAQLKNFGTIVSTMEQAKQDIGKQLTEGLKNVPGSQFKDFSNLQLLKGIEGGVNTETKQLLQGVADTVQQNLQETLKAMPVKEQQKILDYLQNLPGEKEIYTNALQNLSSGTKNYTEFTKNLINIEENLRNSITNSTLKTIEDANHNVQLQIEDTQKIIDDVQDNVQNQIQINLQNPVSDPGGRE